MRVNGERVGRKAMAPSSTKMGHSTKEVGSTTKNTDLEMKSGQMALPTKVNTPKVSRKVRVHSDGPMDQFTLEILLITNSAGLALINGALVEFTLDNGSVT